LTFFSNKNNLGDVLPNISETIQKATEILRLGDIAEPRREANSLLSLALKKDRTFLIAHSEYELTEEEEKLFQEFIERRANYEPFQHIAGRQEFYGLDFIVTSDVLIPRPETELLVEKAVGILQHLADPKFCEIGVGSGCIAVSILHELEKATALGVDISEKALRIAKKNAEHNRVSDRLKLTVSDIFETIQESRKFDLIISNPPYVPVKDIPTLQAEVRDFDPIIALTDGQDGLSIIRKIISQSPKHLKPNGFLLIEFGFNQSAEVRQMFDLSIWQNVELFPDLQGIPRMISVQTTAN
jgi:release factor glutamine methyltransferase